MAERIIRINVDISFAAGNTAAEITALKRSIVRWSQVGWSRFVLSRMKRVVPVRTGRLRDSLKFKKLRNGGRFFFTPRGFYWRFQEGLEEELIKVIIDSLSDLIPWAVRKARSDVGI